MPSITIRNLDEQTKERLRVRAARRKRSMEDEARNILRAAVLEDNPRTGHQVFDGARGEDLTCACQSGDPRANVDCKPADVVAHPLALTGVHARSDFEAGLTEAIADGDSAADGARRPVEGGEESVARRGDLLAAEMFELAAYRRVMLFKDVAPGVVAQR